MPVNLFVKNETEIAALRESCSKLAQVLQEVLATAKPGVTTWDLDVLAEKRIWFVGEIARPIAIIATSLAAAFATGVISLKVVDGNDGFVFIGGVFAGVAVIFGAKAAEEFGKNRNAAKVEEAKAQSPNP